MKHDRRDGDDGRRLSSTPKATLSRALIVIPILAASLTCSLEDALEEYTGVDLIADRGESVDSFIAAHIDGSDPLVPLEYVRLTAVGPAEYGTDAGLTSDQADTIRRLEAVNLVPDGDFEQSTVGLAPVNWDIDAPDSTPVAPAPPQLEPAAFAVDGGGVIQGNSVYFETGGDSAAVLDLDTHALDGFVEPATYFLSLQFVRSAAVTEMTFDYGDGAGARYLYNQPWIIAARTDGQTPLETLPTPGHPLLNKVTVFSAIGVDPAGDYLYVGSPIGASGQSGYLDNVRLGRLDPLPHVAVPISGRNATDGRPLLAGTYRVSVFVKSEIDDQVTPAANGHNRFRADQIVLGLNTHFELIRRSDGGWSENTWERVSADFQIDESDLTAEPPLKVRLTVIHPDRPRIGSLLIADPRLELVTAFTGE